MHTRVFFRAIVWAVVGVVSWAAQAQPGGESVEIDPATVLSDLRGAYRSRAIAEEIRVKVRADGEHGGETMVLSMSAGGALHLDMGASKVWADSSGLRVSPGREARVYYEAPSKDVLATVERELPPIPVPQLVLALASDWEKRDLTAYARGVRWTRARVFPEALPPVALLEGRGEGCEVEIEMDAQSGRLRRMTTKLGGGGLIEVEAEPLPTPGDDVFVFDVESRTRVATLTDLSAQAKLLHVGDEAPAWELFSWPEPTQSLAFAGPAVVVMFRDTRELESVVRVARAAQESVMGEPAGTWAMWCVQVIDFEDQPRSAVDLAYSTLAVKLGSRFERLWFVRGGATTVDRFTSSGANVLLVVDSNRRIVLKRALDRAIEEGEVAGLTNEIAAAMGKGGK